jgi:F0F1-type ATP synthase delta subunit
MKIQKQLRKIVEIAVKNSAKDGKLMENQVKKYVAVFKKLSKPEAIAALSLYLKGIKRILDQHTLVVESAEKLSTQELDKVKKRMDLRFKIYDLRFKINPALLGGVKIHVGDWIFEDSIKSRIDQVKGVIING